MANVIMKALKVKGHLKRIGAAKVTSIRAQVGLPPEMSWWSQMTSGVCAAVREACCRSFCPCCVGVPTWGDWICPKRTCGWYLCTPGQYANEVMKRSLGFLSGLGLTIGIYFFLCMQLDVNMELALLLTVVAGVTLSLGLAFSQAVRCVVLLALPSFASSKGRSFLIMYVMVLILNHPAQNFSTNLSRLSDAATCGQSMALNTTKALVQSAASPIMSVIGGIKTMLAAISTFAKDLRDTFRVLARAVQEIMAVIGSLFSWLASMVDVCNENMGQPYRKCVKVFEDGYHECSDALGIFDFICDVVSLVGNVCVLARIGELLCLVAGVAKDVVLSVVGISIGAKLQDLQEMFWFDVDINWHYHYNMNQSRPYSEVKAAIMAEVKAKMSGMKVISAVLDNVMPFTVLLVVVKALLYRRSYLLKDRYDNCYITRHLYEIDGKRVEMEKETMFPLRLREKYTVIKTFSYKMTESEVKKMMVGMVMWTFAAFNVYYYLIVDYGLYWILLLIRTTMNIQTKVGIPPHLQLHVQGQGPMADMYKAMAETLEPVADDGLDVDTGTCLPDPSVPHWDTYKTVISVMTFTLVMTLFQAYIMRLRHAVCAAYYPHRERARAVWLYNHILAMRGSFVSVMRKKFHTRKENAEAAAKISIKSRIANQCPMCLPLMKLLGHNVKHCLSCGEEGKADDTANFVHCDNCKSPYCNSCFVDLGNVCTACLNPVDYGDGSDLSVEEDSSEDEKDKYLRVTNLRDRKQQVQEKTDDREPTNVMANFKKTFGLPSTPSKLALLEAQNRDRDDSSGDSDDDESSESSTAEEKTNASRMRVDQTSSSSSSLSSNEDTDYQYRSREIPPEPRENINQSRRRPRRSRRRRADMVTTDIFNNYSDSSIDYFDV